MEKKVKLPILAVVLFAIWLVMDYIIWNMMFRNTYTLVNILESLLVVYLCVAMIKKDRNNLLISAIGGLVVLNLFYLFQFLSLISFYEKVFETFINTVIPLVIWASLLVMALAFGEQKYICINEKIKDFCKKYWYLPVILLALDRLNAAIKYFEGPYYISRPICITIQGIIYVAALFFLVQWIIDGYQTEKEEQQNAPADNQDVETVNNAAYCGLVVHCLLCVFTFGIWSLIWTYKTTDYLNKANGIPKCTPLYQLLLCMFVPFYQLFWFYKQGEKLGVLLKEKNLHRADIATICLVLGILTPLTGYILMQDKINSICAAENN